MEHFEHVIEWLRPRIDHAELLDLRRVGADVQLLLKVVREDWGGGRWVVLHLPDAIVGNDMAVILGGLDAFAATVELMDVVATSAGWTVQFQVEQHGSGAHNASTPNRGWVEWFGSLVEPLAAWEVGAARGRKE